MNEGFLVVRIGDVGMENANQFPSYQLIKVNLCEEPKKKCFIIVKYLVFQIARQGQFR